MAVNNKLGTGTDISLTTSWSLGALAATDMLTWINTSTTGAHTGNVTPNGAGGGITINGATSAISLSGTVATGTGGVTVTTADLTLTNTVTVTGAQSWSVASSRTLTVGALAAATTAAALTKTGAGTITTATSSTYNAPVLVNDGTFRVTANTFTVQSANLVTVGASTTTGILAVTGGTFTAAKTTAPSISIGTSTGLGVVKVSGGAITAASDVYFANAANGNAAFLLDGGSATFSSWLQLSRNATAARGYARIDGASTSLTINANGIAINGAGGATNVSTFDFLNGTSNVTGLLGVGYNGSGNANIIGGTHTFSTTATLRATGGSASSLAALNLLGGSLVVPLMAAAATGISNVYFNGGNWETTRTTAASIIPAAVDGVFVGPSGGAITASSATGSVLLESDVNLSVFAGNGVTSIPVSTGGSGYEYPPLVEISGGGGTGASARAIISGGAVTSISITSPGQNYTSAPTVTLVGGTLGTAATLGTVTIGANSASGTFTKAGSSRVVISTTTAGTFDGPIIVAGGEFGVYGGAISSTAAYNLANATNVSVSAGAAFLQNIAQPLSNPHTFSGLGALRLQCNDKALAGAWATYTAGELAGLTGTTAPSASTAGVGPARLFGVNSGLGITSQDYTSVTHDYTYGIAYCADLPSLVNFYNYQSGVSLSTFGTLIYNGADATYPTRIALWNDSANSPSMYAAAFRFDSSKNLTLTGGIERYDTQTGDHYITFQAAGGSSNLTISGTVKDQVTLGGGYLRIFVSRASIGPSLALTLNVSNDAKLYAGGINVAADCSATIQSIYSLGTATTSSHTITSGGALIFDNASGMTFATKSISVGGTGISSAGAIRNIAGANTITPVSISLTSTTSISVTSGSLTIGSGSGAISGSGFGITKIGSAELSIANTANTFTGAVTVSAGTLAVAKLANTSSTSSIGTGAGTSAITISNGATLKFTGTGTDSTNRSLTLPGTGTATLEASGSGTITYTALTGFAGTTLGLAGTSTGSNTVSASLSSTGAISKSGAGKWVLTTTSYTGTTTVSAGTLDFNAQTASIGNISVSGGVLANGTLTPSSTVTLTGGQVTATLAGTSKTITASSGTPEVVPTGGANTLTGSTNVTGGTLRLTTELDVSLSATGRVLGTTNTTVSSGGAIRTSTGTNQKGRMRYGGNLTFQSGSSLYIGG